METQKIGLSKADQLQKNGTLRPKPYKSPEYLSWFHNQGFGCFVCGNTFIEAHHVLSGNRGRPDDSVVPLCAEHHKGTFSPHGGNVKEFHEVHTKDVMLSIAKTLHNRFMEETSG